MIYIIYAVAFYPVKTDYIMPTVTYEIRNYKNLKKEKFFRICG